MKVINGLFDGIVLQRQARDSSAAEFDGLCSATGPVTASVQGAKGPLAAFRDVKVGTASRGKMRGCLRGLPIGGPYTVELRVDDTHLRIRDVWVGDVWLLAGQSNMQGVGVFPVRPVPVARAVRAFYMDDAWRPARDPIHNMWHCVDPVHIDLCGGVHPLPPPPDLGTCPGPSFGQAMWRATGIPQGLIACAHGGTSMPQWNPALKRQGGKSLYGAMIRRLKKNGGRVAGLLWYQGCSDANPDLAPFYTRRMRALLKAVRHDTGCPALPVVMVQISRVTTWAASQAVHWNSIQEQQRLLGMMIPGLVTVPAVDLPLDDPIHISGEGQVILGGRMAQAMRALRGERGAGPLPITLKQVRVEAERGGSVAVAKFDHVAGRLHAGSRPAGFEIVREGKAGNHFDIRLAGSEVRIRCPLPQEQLREAFLHYGYGHNPCCNITDESGRSLPVLGPVALGTPRAITPFAQILSVSHPVPAPDRSLQALSCPAVSALPPLDLRVFSEMFCNLHPEIAAFGEGDGVIWYACRIVCPEAMRLAILLGYDGPVKAWMDGRQVFHDPAGTNPAVVDAGRMDVGTLAGQHDLLVALGTNGGRAWGIHLRAERLDVPLSRRRQGQSTYTLPRIEAF